MVGEFNFKRLHCLGDESYGFIGPMFILVLMSVFGDLALKIVILLVFWGQCDLCLIYQRT
ncbi:NADH-ubiquinone oxidoreductase chain 5 [Gryllus bimaculatus]|nr:NADH-ubiquinone oxidoreductase chain 5 [Gryllus bimaculatus]